MGRVLSASLRTRRAKFLREFGRVIGLTGKRRARAVSHLTRAAKSQRTTTTENVLSGIRNFSPETVANIKYYVRSRRRAKGTLDYDCLLNPDADGRGPSRAKGGYKVPPVHPHPQQVAIGINGCKKNNFTVICTFRGRRRTTLKNVTSVQVRLHR